MKKQAICFAAGFVGAWLIYEACTRNPLWFWRNANAPDSIPEWVVAQARVLGEM